VIQKLGVIGGGQLGRMFTLDAKRMGYDVTTLDPQEHSPCGQVADKQILASYDDMDAIERLGATTDIVTYEFENIAIESVQHLERRGYRVTPSSDVLRITQDRLLEKRFVHGCGIETAPFAAVERDGDVEIAAREIGFPAVIKTTRGGYDGKGQWRANDIAEARAAFVQAKGAPLIWEQMIPFVKELSVVATRGANGDVVTYPVGENEHDAGILATTIAPARVDAPVAAAAEDIARRIGEGLNIVGTYCVELFLTAEGNVLVNEIAPRPHNSGHYTMDVTQCSQYEQHVRALCELPLAQPHLYANAVMINILGTGNGNHLGGVDHLLRDPSIVLHMYGKHHAVARRKMGHFTMVVDGPVDDAVLARARAAHALLRWI
jgi:5-(carboxyamino)imidazole ribonucleotide synthase